jgi:hypothetical protein
LGLGDPEIDKSWASRDFGDINFFPGSDLGEVLIFRTTGLRSGDVDTAGTGGARATILDKAAILYPTLTRLIRLQIGTVITAIAAPNVAVRY